MHHKIRLLKTDTELKYHEDILKKKFTSNIEQQYYVALEVRWLHTLNVKV